MSVRKEVKGVAAFEKEANTKVAKSCVWSFGQQGVSKMVARRLKMTG